MKNSKAPKAATHLSRPTSAHAGTRIPARLTQHLINRSLDLFPLISGNDVQLLHIFIWPECRGRVSIEMEMRVHGSERVISLSLPAWHRNSGEIHVKHPLTYDLIEAFHQYQASMGYTICADGTPMSWTAQ